MVGLTIAIGMMVDGSVVMMENIFVHLTVPAAAPLHRPTAASLSLRIQQAAREVSRPVFFAVVIIIVVFTPLFSLEGVEGKLFQPMAVSIVLAMAASLLMAVASGLTWLSSHRSSVCMAGRCRQRFGGHAWW